MKSPRLFFCPKNEIPVAAHARFLIFLSFRLKSGLSDLAQPSG